VSPGPQRKTAREMTLRFEATLAEVVETRERVRRLLAANDVDPRATYVVDLALEELLGNTVRYGYGSSAVSGEIEVVAGLADDEITLQLTDDAAPFDPTGHPEPTPAPSLEETRIGGLGISMVRHAVDALTYEREGERNCTRVRVKRSAGEG